MTRIDYRTDHSPNIRELIDLYDCVGWSSYTNDPDKLVSALAGSRTVVTARSGELLVGLARVVSDGATIWYLQDVLVRSNFQRLGIGRELIQRSMQGYENVRQKVLLTDDETAQRLFYESMGFAQTTNFRGGSLRAFVRFD